MAELKSFKQKFDEAEQQRLENKINLEIQRNFNPADAESFFTFWSYLEVTQRAEEKILVDSEYLLRLVIFSLVATVGLFFCRFGQSLVAVAALWSWIATGKKLLLFGKNSKYFYQARKTLLEVIDKDPEHNKAIMLKARKIFLEYKAIWPEEILSEGDLRSKAGK
ncbi:MAG: hypothetical protein WCW02_00045 [Candidatus Buchananbacteria bacterium]